MNKPKKRVHACGSHDVDHKLQSCDCHQSTVQLLLLFRQGLRGKVLSYLRLHEFVLEERRVVQLFVSSGFLEEVLVYYLNRQIVDCSFFLSNHQGVHWFDIYGQLVTEKLRGLPGHIGQLLCADIQNFGVVKSFLA